MSLDQNLFTLLFSTNKEDQTILDLVDPSGVVHYRKQFVVGPLYEINVYDPISESLLITATSPSAISKTKVLQLHNPTTIVELKHVGLINTRWTFKWEEHEFEWKKEGCFIVRKPDPPVLVAVSSMPPNRLKPASVQIMDYNLNRFDIDDRKGLEIVLLTALFTFQDQYDANREESSSGETKTPLLGSRKSSALLPAVPPKPEPKAGVERIAEMQAFKGEVNEVTVEEEGEIDDYARHCWNLLKDDAMLFITIRSSSAANVPKVLQIVEETKRFRHKAGVDDEEIHQYVVYDQEKAKGTKRINLDNPKDRSATNYQPPANLVVHLSKIDMPELKPRSASTSGPDSVTKWKSRDKNTREVKGKKKEKGSDKEKAEKYTGKRNDVYQAHKGHTTRAPSGQAKPSPSPPLLPANGYNPRSALQSPTSQPVPPSLAWFTKR